MSAQSVIAIINGRIKANDNSGIEVGAFVAAVTVLVGVGVGVGLFGFWLVGGCVGGAVAEGLGEGEEPPDAKFAKVSNACFGFPLLSNSPKLELGRSV